MPYTFSSFCMYHALPNYAGPARAVSPPVLCVPPRVALCQTLLPYPSHSGYNYTLYSPTSQGLRVLLRQLFRVSLHVSPCAPGEGWAPGVLRAEAEHQELGFLGTVYLDLQDRCVGHVY